MKTWLTADWHLGEDRMGIMARPFTWPQDMIDCLVAEHNTFVKPEDEVIVVGDVCYQKAPQYLSQVTRFNGHKILIRGNHDRVFTDEQLRPYFETIVGDGGGFYQQIGAIPCYLTHYPTEGVVNAFNLVGHIHSAWKYQLNMFNVGVDVNHFRPVDIETIPDHFKAVCEFYDEDVWVAYNHKNASYSGKRGKMGTYFRPSV